MTTQGGTARLGGGFSPCYAADRAKGVVGPFAGARCHNAGRLDRCAGAGMPGGDLAAFRAKSRCCDLLKN